LDFRYLFCCFEIEEEEEDFAKTAKAHSEGADPPFGALSRRGLTPIKLAYNLHWLDGLLH